MNRAPAINRGAGRKPKWESGSRFVITLFCMEQT